MDLGEYALDPLRRDEDLILYRGQHRSPTDRKPLSILLLVPVSQCPAPETVKKLEHEYSLRSELDAAWAVRPLTLSRHKDRIALVLEDPGGQPLDRLIHGPMEVARFLRLAVDLVSVLTKLHKRGLIHKDLKPHNVLVDSISCKVWLTGFGIASRLPRERPSPEPPEFIAGTLAYMAPEQTGRMNRSIDARSDLYALGVTLYELLTGVLPFTASDPMEWVHFHMARLPVPPSERHRHVPVSISAIIMKLLAKTPEDRYQTAVGAENDLRRCVVEWNAHGRVDEFVIAQHDTPSRLLIPEKLYGRASEIEMLWAAFDRVVSTGRTELVLVSGYSGIGKSSVVNELQKVLVPPRGLFASGKFDQYKRDIPYSTLAHCFQGLIRPLLGKSEGELRTWRNQLRDALEPNGQLIVDLSPELKVIIGEQPPVRELPTQDAQHRFHLVLRRFIGVFATPEHPLALFLDDLQWLDTATLDVLQDLLTQPDIQQLMLVGAYRDNEINSAHPLMQRLEAIRQAGGKIQEIVLAPLSSGDLGRLIADSLHCSAEAAVPLAQLTHEKTAGNPFFAIQFISALAEEGLLKFDDREARWVWDLNLIHAKGYTDNVADLMVGKLNRLPLGTQNALQQLACLGNRADFATIQMIFQQSSEGMHSQLWEAVKAGLIFRSEHSYRFLHDRVQEAAYSLIPETLRAEAHLQIGRLLAEHTPPEMREERIFEIVNQLNRGSHLINSTEERNKLAELNLIAGRRAKSSTAYFSALTYLTAARVLLMDEAPRGRRILFSTLASHLPWSRTWAQNYGLIFATEYLIAECELLTADMVVAEDRLSMLAQCAKSGHDIAIVTRLRLTLYTTLDRSDRAVEVCLEYLRRGGTDWSPHPTSDEVQREYDRIWSQLGNRQIEEFIDAPLMTNPDVLDALEVLSEAVTPALFCDERLSSLVICRMVNLSLEHGNCDASCFAYVWLAIIAGPRFGNYKDGFRFGQLGYDLVEKRGLKRFQARTYMSFGDIVMPWTKHVQAGRDLVRRAFDAANEIGDVTFAAYSCDHLIKNLLAVGDPLADVQREAENAIAFAKKVRFGLVIDHLSAQLGLVRTLRGLTPKFGSFNDGEFDELRFEHRLANNPALAELECWYWVRRLQARFFAGDYASAIDAALNAQRQLWTSPSQFETAELSFYGALSHAASWDSASPDQRQQHFETLKVHHRQLEVWAENCPENFENRATLVGAEVARIEGRDLDAMRLYEQAIRSAHTNGFIHNEAIANETAARFYLARGFEKIAYAYLKDARYCYSRWGATAKLHQLADLYPHLWGEEPLVGSANMIGAPVELLDLGTIIKVSQAVSAEVVPERLIDTLMRRAIEHAAAERGLLILQRGNEQWIEAEATISGETFTVHLRQTAVAADAMPESILHYVIRTQESVILDDASTRNPFSADTYIVQRHARSILCLPLINQAKFIGVLYLENNLTSHVFTPARITILKVLASQAAISLENTRLYRDIAAREARIRRLVDANVIGIVMWNLEGAIVEANEAFLHMVQYGREDVASGRVRWTDLTPPEWHERDQRALADLKATGMVHPYEKEYFRKDGSRVPVLVAGALFEEGRDEGVAFALDLSEQKRAEGALHRSENYLAEAQRLTLTGSCAIDGKSREAVYWSEEMFRLFGLDPQQGLPTWDQWLQWIHPEDRDTVKLAADRTFLQKVDSDVEFRILKYDGAVKHIYGITHPVLNPNGELVQVVATLVDITERTHAEEALRRSEQNFRSIVNGVPGLVFTATAEGEIEFINQKLLDYTGRTLEELKGWATSDLIHPDDLPKVVAAAIRSIETGEPETIEHRLRGADGVYRWFGCSRLAQRDSQGRIIRWYLLLSDIHERKHAEESLRRSESYLAQAQHLAHIGSWAWQIPSRNALYISDEWYRIYGFDPQDGMPSWEERLKRVHPEDRARWQKAIDRAITEKSDYDVEFRILPPHMPVRFIHSVGRPVLGSSGELLQFVGIAMDVTERKRADEERQRLRQAETDLAYISRVRTMGELTASLAHEIKQPIGAAVTNADACVRLLDRDQPDVAEALEAALEMVRDARRAADIIDRVRSLYRKGASQLELVDVNEVIGEMALMLHNEANRHSVTIRTELAKSLPRVMADRIQLQQVLMNLMLNGIEAMRDTTGELSIKSQLAEDGQLVVSVADTGVGLPTADLDRIFNAFFTTKPQGTGLGLAITRSIVESHGGRVWATANPGRGASFHFTLPSGVALSA